MNYLDTIQPAIDQFGLIAQMPSDSRDGGDTSQREGMLLLLSYAAYRNGKIDASQWQAIQSRYVGVYARLRKGCMPGEIRRHDGDSKWYDLPWRMSRDQWTPNVISLGIVKQNRLDMLLGMAMRLCLFTTNVIPNAVVKGDAGFKHQLPDITVLSSWGYVMRWVPWATWPALLVTDLDLLVNSVIWWFRLRDPSNTNTDILNHVNSLTQAMLFNPTPISWLARKILPWSGVIGLLQKYFAVGGPPLDVIANDALKDSW